MKKFISLLSSIAVCMSLNSINAMAEDTPVNINTELYGHL